MTLPTWLKTPDPTIYERGSYVVLDFETIVNDGRYGSAVDERNALALACWKRKGADEVRRLWGSEFEQQELLDAIGAVDFVVAHNAQYECGWLRRCGIDLRRVLVFDTKIAEYVLLGNRAAGDFDTGVPPVSTSLDSCARRRGDLGKDPIVDLWMAHGVSVADMPRRWVEDRCVQDVETTERLFKSQLDSLRRSGRLACVFTRCLLTPVLADIARHGMCLDPVRVKEVYDETSVQLVARENELAALTGGINWRSPKQVADYLYDTLGFAELTKRDGTPRRTGSGGRLTDKPTLDALRADTDAQRAFLRLRSEVSKLGSAISKNLRYFKGACEDSAGIFRAEFNQTRTATHRLSSSGIPNSHGSVQLQNLPRAFKRLFRARSAGWLVAEADGAQLEFRVAAFLGNDSQAKHDIADPDFDVHILSGSAMAKLSYSDALARYRAGDKKMSELRTAAKRETFKPLYGGQKGTKEQERWYATFRSRYPELAATQQDWVNEVVRTKRLVTPWGLRFYWPHAKMSQSGYVNVTASVYNYPVQSLATAEIIPIAVVYLWHRLRHLDDKVMLVNTVHDSVVAELHPDAADEFREIVKTAFTDDVYSYLARVYGIDFDVPLGSECKIGTHWGEDKSPAQANNKVAA
jgi:DNA polymerase I-like protein with 3'-5' exonuclease and polymerase domains